MPPARAWPHVAGQAWVRTGRWMGASPTVQAIWDRVRQSWTYAVLLAAALGTALAVGAHLSNAYPSEAKPFGWPGAASFDGAVATVRPELILASTVPALLMGLRVFGSLGETRLGPRTWFLGSATDLVLLMAAAFAAGGMGVWAASKTQPIAYVVFSVAHGLLACSFYAVAGLGASLWPRHSAALPLVAWAGFVVVFEDWVRWRLFRKVGYTELQAGHLPMWFYATQVASPVSLYRDLLIVWRPGFRDYVEKAALTNAELPPWLTPMNLILVHVVVWILLPLELAALAWTWRWHHRAAPSRRATTHGRRQPSNVVPRLPGWLLDPPADP